ncbi:hypothetical protein DFH08DRAFT_967039 [Mycena albidolilacea]|uniref:Uncharacterized protein n=1 Tax=Mycena albidolilacea TaxID=1033008 RepID=A0AAD6ZNS3_9AGAR|nr:hypothetical protein DFH08DRAFT_967039 [Mycena albidolilacea]
MVSNNVAIGKNQGLRALSWSTNLKVPSLPASAPLVSDLSMAMYVPLAPHNSSLSPAGPQQGQALCITNLGMSSILGEWCQSYNTTPLEVFSNPDNLYIPNPDHPVFLNWRLTMYAHMSATSCALLQLLVATMEPTGALTHPHWLASHPDPKDLCMSSVDIQQRVKEIRFGATLSPHRRAGDSWREAWYKLPKKGDVFKLGFLHHFNSDPHSLA